MSDRINLSKPHRTIQIGVILVNALVSSLSLLQPTTNTKHRETEILDIAPIDTFNAISTKFVNNFPEGVLPEHLRAQALDVEFHWVNETGKPAALTAGAHVNITVGALLSSVDYEI